MDDLDSMYEYAILMRDGVIDNKGNENKYFEILLLTAESGHSISQYNVATIFEQKNDPEKVKYWFKKASEQNHLPAIIELAELLLKQKEYEQAGKLFLQAANLGHTPAIKQAYDIYVNYGVKFNKKEIIRLAAHNGESHAQYLYGRYLYERDKKDRILSDAIKWFKLAADQGHSKAINFLADIYIEISYFERLTIWLKQLSTKGYPTAVFKLADYYISDTGQKTDVNDQDNWLIKAANLGHTPSKVVLGNKNILSKNMDKAIYWLDSAATAGSSEALNTLIELLRNQKEYDEAVDWLAVSYLEGNTSASDQIYDLVKNKLAYPNNLKRQLELLKHSSDSGNLNALYLSGVFAENSSHLKIAVELYTKASELGHPFAKSRLARQLLKYIPKLEEDSIKKSYKIEAYRLSKEAAHAGVAQGMFNYAALSYEFGDKATAYTYSYLATEAGVPSAFEIFEFIEQNSSAKEIELGYNNVLKWKEESEYLLPP